MELQSEIMSQDVLSAIMLELGPGATKQSIAPCPECQTNSREGFLKDYFVSLDDSVIFCDNDLCCYTAESLSDVQSVKPAEDNDLEDFLSSLCDIETASPTLSGSEMDAIFTPDSPPTPSAAQGSGSDNSTVGPTSNDTCTNHSPQHSLMSIDPFPSPSQQSTTNTKVCQLTGCFKTNTSTVNSIVSSSDLNNHSLTVCETPRFGLPTDSCSNTPVSTSKPKANSIGSLTTSVASASPQLDLLAMEVTPELPELNRALEPYSSATQHIGRHLHCKRHRYVMLWYNIDALCWLDVLLAVLCNNTHVRKLLDPLPYSCVVKKLLLAYDESQALIEPLQAGDKSLLHSVMENDSLSVKRGGGYCMDTSSSLLDSISKSTVLSSQEITSAKRKVHLAGIKLECVREEVWQFIEPLLRCERGKDDSPVFAFPLVLRSDKSIEKLFVTEYTWSTRCTTCHHQQVDRKSDVIITFPKIQTFEVNKNMVHLRDCIKCLAPNQKRKLEIQKYSPNFVMHFADGMKDFNVNAMAFTTSRGERYVVRSVVEYKVSPNHFVLWQRDFSQGQTGGNWMCYDDLRSQYAQFSHENFAASTHNIHIVFWERVQSTNSVTHSAPQAPLSSDESNLLEGVMAMDTGDKYQVDAPSASAGAFTEHSSLSPTVLKDCSVTTKLTNPVPVSKAISSGTKSAETIVTPAQSAPSRKSLPLLSAKIGTQRRTLTGSMRYGVPVATTANSSVQQVSLTDAISSLSPLSHLVDSAPLKPPQSSLNSAKSYLDVIQPLLKKHKQQKGNKMGGYVPKSQRKADDKLANSKKVQFSGLPYMKPSSTASPRVPHLAKVEVEVPVTNPGRTNTTRTYTKHKNASMILPNSTRTVYTSSSKSTINQTDDSMPTLEDMLKDIC